MSLVPVTHPAYTEAPGSGGSGVVYVIYDATTGETSNGCILYKLIINKE